MKAWFGQLDAILRGDATKMTALESGRIEIPIGGLSVVLMLLAMFAGACMGSYAVVREGMDGLMQLLASAIKLPLLFLLTLLITLPSLYVFNALVGSRLNAGSVLRLLIAANGVILAVFASLGTIVVFFGLSTTSYPFMKLLNIVAIGIGGVFGLTFLLRTLHRLVWIEESKATLAEPLDEAIEELSEDIDETDNPSDKAKAFVQKRNARQETALDRVSDRTPDKAKSVFRIWVVVYALVGMQTGWVLRPFIGAPDMAFTWFRERESNFFLDLIETLSKLLAG